MRQGQPNPKLRSLAWMLSIAVIALCDVATAATAGDLADDSQDSKVELIGTLLLKKGSDHQKIALIRVNGDDARWYSINQAITPTMTLVDVELRSVQLRQHDKILQLKFSTQLSAAATVAEQAPPPMPALPAHANAMSTPVPGIVHLSDTHIKLSRKVVTDYLYSFEALRDNRASLLDEGGLFITRLRSDSVLEKAGFRVGDVLTAVDGKPLKNLSDVQRLLGQFNDSKKPRRVDLELIRFGTTQHLTYDLSE